MINWKFIMLHHSLTKDTATVSWDAIRRYHMETMGWKAIAYHFGVELVGPAYEILPGRPLTEAGAHCKEGHMNRLAIGICVVGNFDLAPPPPEQLIALGSLVKTLMQAYNIPIEHIVLHRFYATYKSCPGKLFPVKEFLSSVS